MFSRGLLIQWIMVVLIVGLELNMYNSFTLKLALRNKDKW